MLRTSPPIERCAGQCESAHFDHRDADVAEFSLTDGKRSQQRLVMAASRSEQRFDAIDEQIIQEIAP
jgi:hypothetical protein